MIISPSKSSKVGLAADGAGVGADAGRGLRRRDGHGALVPDVGVRAGGGDDLGLGRAADGAGIGHGAGVGLGRLRGHGAAVPLMAERGLDIALFARLILVKFCVKSGSVRVFCRIYPFGAASFQMARSFS